MLNKKIGSSTFYDRSRQKNIKNRKTELKKAGIASAVKYTPRVLNEPDGHDGPYGRLNFFESILSIRPTWSIKCYIVCPGLVGNDEIVCTEFVKCVNEL